MIRRRILSTICILLFFVLPPAALFPADLQEAAPVPEGYLPGKLIVRPVSVIHDGPEAAEFTARVTLPEGWRLLSGAETITFREAGKDLLLVGFYPPGNAPAGSYTVSVNLESADVTKTLDLPVEIMPVQQIDCALLEQPDYILAGDAYRVVFACSNRGNVPLTAGVKAVSGSGFDMRAEALSIAMLPGETVRLAVIVDTPINLYTQVRHNVRLELTAAQDDTVKARSSSSVDVIPRTTGRESRYNTILGEFSTRGVLQHGDADLFGLEAGVTGQGFLDEDGETFLLFRLKDALAGAGTLIPDREEYLLRVDGAGYSVGMGTQFYSLSPLTEASTYGAGVSLAKDFGPLSVSGFAVDSLLDGLNESRYASRLSYLIGDRGRAAVNLLEASEAGRWTAGSLQGHYLTPIGGRIETEYAFSSGSWTDEAFYVSTGGSTDRFAYSLKYLHAGPRFRGSLEDQEQILASVAYTPARDVRLRASGGRKNYDLALDIPESTVFTRFGLSWTGLPGALLTADVLQTRERAAEESSSLRLGFMRTAGPMDLRLSYEFGNTLSLTGAARTFSERLTARLDVTSHMLGDLTASVSRQFLDHASRKTPYTDLSLSWDRELSSRAALSAVYRTVNSQQSFYEGADNLTLSLHYSLPNQSDLDVTAKYGPDRRTGSAEDLTVTVGFSSPFPIPVSVKKNIGRIEGKVIDGQTGQAVPEVILRLGSAVAVTDSFGVYTFHSLMPGMHRLYIDPASLPADYIPAEPMPLEVAISETAAERDIRITKAAFISGRVVMYRFDRNYRWLGGDQGAAYVDPRGVSGVLLTVKDEDGTVRRALTGEDGGFIFPALEPASWSLRVPKDILPEGHFLAKEEFDLVLEPGQREDIVIKIFPKVRQIRFIDQGTITEEEAPEETPPEEPQEETAE